MTHAEATAYLLDHPTEAVYFRAVDATGHYWRSVPCWIAARELTMAHPTDAKRYTAAPVDVAYTSDPAAAP